MKSLTDTFQLRNKVEIPCIGYGTWKTPDGETASASVRTAIELGYRHIDTAAAYGNETSVGEGIRESGISREQLFVTSKVWNTERGYEKTLHAFEKTCQDLGTDYLDLYLIHWPVPGCYLSTWKVLEEIQKSGRALSIGVSNFEIRHLEELEANSGIIPAVNQIECHPLCYPKELIDYCQNKGIQVQAYAPLARGAYLDNDVMCVLGTKYAHTPAQIGLRWATQKGISVIPKSVHPDRIRSNGNIFDFTIEQEDMDLIDTLNENFHSSHVPEDLRDIAF